MGFERLLCRVARQLVADGRAVSKYRFKLTATLLLKQTAKPEHYLHDLACDLLYTSLTMSSAWLTSLGPALPHFGSTAMN